MSLESIVSAHLEALPPVWDAKQSAEVYVEECTQAWRELGRTILERQFQQQIETTESAYSAARSKRLRSYQTPVGTVALTRRVYDSDESGCRVDEDLGLPSDGWFRSGRELASALGVGSEFGNANRLLHRWSGVSVWRFTARVNPKRCDSCRLNSLAKMCCPDLCYPYLALRTE